jgi:DNA-binding NtrC family response regulator
MTGKETIHLLMVDDEKKFLDALTDRLRLQLFDVTSVTTGSDAIKIAEKGGFDVAVVDLQMPEIDGVQLLETLKSSHSFLEVIILSGHATIETAVACTKLGAFKILEKPCKFDLLVETIKDAYELRLKKKFENNEAQINKIQSLAFGQSPLGILRELSKIDDDVK